jgi:hypothetical protein
VLNTTTETPVARPEFFRLPRPGEHDCHFGFSRSFYYNGEQRHWWKLIRIRDEGKERGVTLIPYQQVAEFVQRQMEEQEQSQEDA